MPYLLERRLPDEISIARLHGEACIGCGATRTDERPLKAAGEITVVGPAGETKPWTVVTCPDCILRETP